MSLRCIFMKIKKIENQQQKVILTGLIVSDVFCNEILPILLNNKDLMFDLFSESYKIVINWISDFWKKYQKAPHKNIQEIYKESYDKVEYEATNYQIISGLLSSLSDDFERQEHYNEQFAIDRSKIFLRKANLDFLRRMIDNLLRRNQVDVAEEYISKFSKIEKETDTTTITDVINDFDVVDSAINLENEKLFRFHGAFGDLIGDLMRGDLIAFSAPGKGGKSQLLFETALVAMMEGLRVVLFSFEMPRNQCLRRLYQMFCGEVFSVPESDGCISIPVPYFLNKDNAEIGVKYVKKYGLNAKKIIKKIKSMRMHMKGGGLKLVTPPAYSMSIKKLSRTLDGFVLEGFVPDVIIVDYADIMYSIDNKNEYRHMIDSIWKGLRSIAQEKNCLVATASHSGRSTYGKDQTESDIVEDIRKLNHVAIMIALNQNKKERSEGIMRPEALVHRHKSIDAKEKVIVLQDYRIGRPYLDSRLVEKVEDGK